MSDTLDTIGTILKEDSGRDAVHVAVMSATASQELRPGWDVGLREDGLALAVPQGHPKALGIVDPFLRQRVQEGERFWLFLYPKQITSLRHVWTHPSIRPEALPVQGDKLKSELWLRRFIETADCPSYEIVMSLITAGKRWEDDEYGGGELNGEHMFFSGWDAHGEIPDEFWDHVEIVTGKRQTQRPKYFSCSC